MVITLEIDISKYIFQIEIDISKYPFQIDITSVIGQLTSLPVPGGHPCVISPLNLGWSRSAL